MLMLSLHFWRRLLLAATLVGVAVLGACGGGGGSPQAPTDGPQPSISSFSASPNSISSGQSAVLTWSVKDATNVSIDNGIGTVLTQTSVTVNPLITTTYTLTASNARGSVLAATTLTVSPSPPPYPVGLTDDFLLVNGVRRDYRVHVPASLGGATPKAIVLVLHGGGGAGLSVANTGAHPLAVFRTVADREGFVVVYPGGLPQLDGGAGWNDCRNDNSLAAPTDDIAFLDALIDRIRSQYKLPGEKVFMAGGSNGAQMTFSYALARSERVAAIATSNGNLPVDPKPGACRNLPARPIPVLMAHGTADPAMPYGGGCVANVGSGCARGRVISAEATRNFWLEANGLANKVPSQTIFEVDSGDGGPANRFQYQGVPAVEWWRMDGGGHPVSSQAVLIPTNPTSGIQNRDVEFAEIAWSFFNKALASGTVPTSTAIAAARDYSSSVGGQTFLIMHNGKILDEAYANGGAPERVQLLASATKGFTGMVGAIAASDGLFNLDEPVASRAITEWKSDPVRSRITFRHLLTMASGLQELNDLPGWSSYLNAQAINDPGNVFIYSGDPNILGLAMQRLLPAEKVEDYFSRKLFSPLGMTSVRWASNFSDGNPQLSGGAYATARDWAKFGEFVRLTTSREWNGSPLLEASLFDQVFQGSKAHPAYGFYWWLKESVPAQLAATIDANNKEQFSRQIKPIIDDARVPDDFVMAAGAYGQRLYIIPSRGLTIVRNGPANDNRFEDEEFLARLFGP